MPYISTQQDFGFGSNPDFPSPLCLIRVLVCSQHTKKDEISASSGYVAGNSKSVCTSSEFRYEVVRLADQLELFCILLRGRRLIMQTVGHILMNVYNHIPECFVVSESPCGNFDDKALRSRE